MLLLLELILFLINSVQFKSFIVYPKWGRKLSLDKAQNTNMYLIINIIITIFVVVAAVVNKINNNNNIKKT